MNKKPEHVETWMWRQEDVNHLGKCITCCISFLQKIQTFGKPFEDCFHTISILCVIGAGGAHQAHFAPAPSILSPQPFPAASPTPWPRARGAVEAQSILRALTLIASEVFEQHFKSFLPQCPSRTNKVFVVVGVKNSSR